LVISLSLTHTDNNLYHLSSLRLIKFIDKANPFLFGRVDILEEKKLTRVSMSGET
jgi:hypothetical protein